MYSLASYLDGQTRKRTRSERKAAARREENLKRRIDRHYTEEEWEALCLIYGHRCAYCGMQCRNLTKDHVIPIARGGENTIRNLVPACWDCNQNKGSRLHDPRPTYLLPSMEQELQSLRPELRAALGY